jgi:hypothetical protein
VVVDSQQLIFDQGSGRERAGRRRQISPIGMPRKGARAVYASRTNLREGPGVRWISSANWLMTLIGQASVPEPQQ